MVTFVQGLLLALIVWELLASCQKAARRQSCHCVTPKTHCCPSIVWEEPHWLICPMMWKYNQLEAEEGEYGSVSGEEETDHHCKACYSATSDRWRAKWRSSVLTAKFASSTGNQAWLCSQKLGSIKIFLTLSLSWRASLSSKQTEQSCQGRAEGAGFVCEWQLV